MTLLGPPPRLFPLVVKGETMRMNPSRRSTVHVAALAFGLSAPLFAFGQEFVTKEFVTRIRDQTGVALWENGDREASIHAFRGRPAFPEEVTEPKTK